MQTGAPGLDALEMLVRHHLKPPIAAWLAPRRKRDRSEHAAELPTLIPAHIKHLKTPAHSDPRAVRQERKAARLAKRVKR